MARINIKSMREPILILDDKAKKLSQLMSDFADKKIEDTWVDTELWKGWLSQVKSIEFDPDRKYSGIPESKPMTPEEEKRSQEAMIKVRETLFGKKK